MSELANRLHGAGTKSERDKIEAEFDAECANPPEVVERYARILDGEVSGRTAIRCLGPPPTRLEVTLQFNPSKPDGFALHPLRYDDPAMSVGALRACRAHFLKLIDDAKAKKRAPSLAAITGKNDAERERRKRYGIDLWEDANDSFGLAKVYLEGRGITIAERFARRVIRVRYGGKTQVFRYNQTAHEDEQDEDAQDKGLSYPHHIMICEMRDVLDDVAKAVHITPFDEDWNVILDPDGKKARRTYGSPKGAAIKLHTHQAVIAARALVVGEGLETCLSALQMGAKPVWAMGSVYTLGDLPVIPWVDDLIILGERDNGASDQACKKCIRNWQMAGKSVRVVLSKAGYGDFNDQLRGAKCK